MKKSYIIGIVVIAAAFAIIVSTVSKSSTYADFGTAADHPGKVYHVVGTLNLDRPFEYDPEVNANIFGFFMKDNNGVEYKVLYNGTKPQDFEKSEQIVIIGKMKDEVFVASDILMKCPSKYAGNEMQQQNLPNP